MQRAHVILLSQALFHSACLFFILPFFTGCWKVASFTPFQWMVSWRCSGKFCSNWASYWAAICVASLGLSTGKNYCVCPVLLQIPLFHRSPSAHGIYHVSNFVSFLGCCFSLLSEFLCPTLYEVSVRGNARRPTWSTAQARWKCWSC